MTVDDVKNHLKNKIDSNIKKLINADTEFKKFVIKFKIDVYEEVLEMLNEIKE